MPWLMFVDVVVVAAETGVPRVAVIEDYIEVAAVVAAAVAKSYSVEQVSWAEEEPS